MQPLNVLPGRVRLAAVVAASILIGADVLTWRAEPGVRNAHAMVYDESRQEVVLFGGANASSVMSDTWTWDGRRWRELDVQGPPPRTFPGMVWDAAREEAVLFGGRSVLFGRSGQRGTCLGDTWVLRRDGWHLRARTGPAARTEAGLAYDRRRGVAVLFGGYHDTDGSVTRLGDTWEWDGSKWALRSEGGPVPRSGVAMAYDETLRRVVLFGGNGGPRADTWMWDGRQWAPADAQAVPGRFNSVVQYDSLRQRLVRTTGWNGRERVRETWLFDHPNWRLVSSDGPSARNHSAAAFDRRRGRLVLHGGHDGDFVFGDTWEWDGRAWQPRVDARPQRRVENGH